MRFNVLRGAARSPLRRAAVAACALTLGSSAVVLAATAAQAAAGCSVQYTIQSQWPGSPGGFSVSTNVTNLGDPVTSWTLQWTFTAGQTVAQGWNGNFTTGTQAVTVTNAAWNGTLGTNQSVQPGFNGTWNGTSNPVPAQFTLNGTVCTGGVTTPPSSVPPSSNRPSSQAPPSSRPPSSGPPSSRPPSSVPVSRPVSSGPSSSGNGNPPPHLPNPYMGAKGYVNADWAAKAAAEPGGTRVSGFSTAVWLDSINSITAPAGSGYTTSLTQHLNNAVSQAAGGIPVVIEFVIYDLPGRDCAALASNGEIAQTDLPRYENDYITPIANILAQPQFANLRIVTIIEPDSLPNLVTNANGQAGATSQCATMLQNGNYVAGVQFALNKLHAISNVYTYIDAAHDAWLGWSTNFDPAITLFHNVVAGTTAGMQSADGFITDTANTLPLREPFMTSGQTVGGQQINSHTFYQSNPYIQESTYASDFWTKATTTGGFPASIGMLIDTGRNGWGGPDRPTAASTSTDLNTFVNASKIDKRPARGDWCNPSGAGIGERPTAAPAPNIDAYVWIKPPGESDGSSSLIPQGPDNPAGKGFDQMCDPTYGGNARNNNSPTGALPNAPVSGAWFPTQFQQLMANAFPAL
jgi:cellulose 1,4-beta-cellobiosidase